MMRRVIMIVLLSAAVTAGPSALAQQPSFAVTESAIGFTQNAWSFMTAWNLSTGDLQVSGKWFNGSQAWNFNQPNLLQWVAKFIYDDATGSTRELQWTYTQPHIQ